MDRRIYFVTSDYDDSDVPTNTLCYRDPGASSIVSVSTNGEYDLGTGFIARVPDGRIVVEGLRWHRYLNVVYHGDWFESSGREDLVYDTLLYTLDANLANPVRLAADSVEDRNLPREGFEPTWIGNASSQVFNFPAFPFYDENYGIVLVGCRFKPYTEADSSGGTMVHTYTKDGALVRRQYPYEGYYEFTGYPDGMSSAWACRPNWACYDKKRGLVYMTDGSELWRFNMQTGVMQAAPRVFGYVTTQGGWDYTDAVVQSYLASPDGLVQGPWPNGSWSYIEHREYFRSRRVEQIAVDPATGYVWAMVHGYEPVGQEYAADGGTPLSEYPGGYGEPGDEWNLICIDPNQLFYIPDITNPYPYDYVDANGNRQSTLHDRFADPLSDWPQKNADVKIITVNRGQQPVNLANPRPGTEARPTALYIQTLCIPEDEPGCAYYSADTPYFDEVQGEWTTLVAVYRVDLETGISTELFVDDRRTSAADGGYLIQAQMFQIVPGPFAQISGRLLGDRRDFKGVQG